MSSLNRLMIGSALALMINALGFSAQASAPEPIQRSVTVQYRDLSLQRPADVKILYQRLRAAADVVCGPREATGSRLPTPSYQRCFDAAVGNAVDAVNSPALSVYYHSKLDLIRRQTATLAQR